MDSLFFNKYKPGEDAFWDEKRAKRDEFLNNTVKNELDRLDIITKTYKNNQENYIKTVNNNEASSEILESIADFLLKTPLFIIKYAFIVLWFITKNLILLPYKTLKCITGAKTEEELNELYNS